MRRPLIAIREALFENRAALSVLPLCGFWLWLKQQAYPSIFVSFLGLSVGDEVSRWILEVVQASLDGPH